MYRHTSGAAWDSFLPYSADLDRQIMTALDLHEPVGLTCQGIEDHTGRIHQAVSGNLRHLVERGLVVPTNTYGVTRSGRNAIIWRIAPPSSWGLPRPKKLSEVERLRALAGECRSLIGSRLDPAIVDKIWSRHAQELDVIATALEAKLK